MEGSPATHGEPISGNRKSKDDLRKVGTVILGIASLAQVLFLS